MDGQATERIPVAGSTALPSDLRARIVFGVLLAAGALGANWAGPKVFALLIGCIGLVLSWEWSRIVRSAPLDAGFLVQGAAVGTAGTSSSLKATPVSTRTPTTVEKCPANRAPPSS